MDIEPITFKHRLKWKLLYPWRAIFWIAARLRLLWRFVLVMHEARKLELELQSFKQSRDDHAFANRKEEHLVEKGFCAGLEYALGRLKRG